MSFTLRSGPWSPTEVEAWLTETVIPIRLGTEGKKGPLVQSLWFQYMDGSLWCATQSDSVLAKRVRRSRNIGWEVSPDAPPYRGVRGTGIGTIITDPVVVESTLRSVISRYGQADTPLATWLLGRLNNEIAVRIDDLRITSWDYSPRM